MEFDDARYLLITQNGQLFDRARLKRVEETGNGRVLHGVSTLRHKEKEYQIGEVDLEKETWQVILAHTPEDEKLRYRPNYPTLTLEII